MAVTDDFNRADGALGSNWTSVYGTAPSVFSNKCRGAAWAASGLAMYNGAFPNDQYAECKVSVADGIYDKHGPAVRCSTASGGSAYVMIITVANGNANVYKLVNGSMGETPFLAWASMGLSAFADGDTAKLAVSGTTITPYKNGSAGTGTTDSDISSGNPGVWADNGASGSTYALDDFAGTDAAGSGGIISRVGGGLVGGGLVGGGLVQ